MSRILVIHASPLGEHSVTRRLTQTLVEGLQDQSANAAVVVRDLTETPPPHLDGAILGAFMTDPSARSREQADLAHMSDTLIGEVKAADAIIIGAPMYNFSIPSVLKAWIDHVARAGQTFRYTESGPEGLLDGKTAYVVTSRGGYYSEGSPAADMDFVTPYLQCVLGFIGIDDIRTVTAEGVAMGEEQAQAAVARAETEIGHVLAA